MTDSDQASEDGLVVVLLERLRTQRLPRALGIKEKVDAGGTLDQSDMDFLAQVFEEADANQAILDRHPELHQIAAQMIRLYREITERALANETGSGTA